MKTITTKVRYRSLLILMIGLLHGLTYAQVRNRETTTLLSTQSPTTSNLEANVDGTAACNANDFYLTDFYLADINGQPLDNNCTPGTPQTAYIFAYFGANTNANRYSLYLSFDYYINGQFVTSVSDCLYPNQPIPVGQNLQVQELTWNCGDQVEMVNFYMAWQANSGASCGTNPSKCYSNPTGYIVRAPLIANFSNETVCNSYQINFTDGTTGGDIDNPYTYVWNFGDGTTGSGANPSHTYSAPGTYSVTLTVTDNDGVVDSQTYDVTVIPLLSGLSLSATNIPCSGGTTGSITASGPVGGVPGYTYSISPEPAGYSQSGNTFSNLPAGTYTVTATDQNNCTISADITISIADNIVPIINAPTDSTLEGCSTNDISGLGYSETIVTISESDFIAAGGSFTEANVASITYQDSSTGTCPIVVTRTFTITDDCGLTASDTQTININDTIAPVAPTAPSDVTYECISDVPAAGDLTAVDACDGNITVTGSDSTDSSNPCDVVITRTWTFTDNCNNTSSVTQTIHVIDTLAPVAPAAPSNESYQCLADVPAPGNLTATDNCVGDIISLGVDSIDNSDPCNVVITRTWTFTDNCNNSSSVSQTINVQDTTAPVAPAAPADTSYQCLTDLPAAGDLTAVDNCEGDITVTGTDSLNNSDPCNIEITRTWTFTDSCSNSSSVSQTITISDTTAPVAPVAPANETYQCLADVPAAGNLSATDNCLGTISVTGTDSVDNTDPCNIVITRTWEFEDDCNNTSSISQTITVSDTLAPVAPAAPADMSYQCLADVPAPGDLSATDNCSGTITVTGVDSVNDADPCNITVTRTWTFTDDCNNSSSVTQTISVSDTTAPTFTTVAADQTVLCDGSGNTNEYQAWLNTHAGTVATDNCSDVTWSYNVLNVIDQCGSTSTTLVQFTATDDCNNSSSSTALFTIIDLVPPTMTTPASDLVLECGPDNTTDINNWINANGNAQADDACSTVTWSNDFNIDDLEACNGAVLVTFIATDDCGNEISTSASISIEDNTPPTLTSPASDIAIECSADGDQGGIEAWLASNGGATATDNCNSEITWTNTYGGDASDCSQAIAVTFTATDACGNSVSTTASYAVQDTTPPTITDATSSTVECDGSGNIDDLNDWLASNGGATASDDCSAVAWSNDFSALSDDCGETGSATVTFTATDGCGNAASTTATFTIIDTIAPVAPDAPADITYECIGDMPAAGELTATDNCAGDITATAVDSMDDTDPCNIVVTRTWTFTDACNNSSSVSQTITIQDTTAPVAPEAPADITYECIGDMPAAGQLTATDNCAGDITATAVDSMDDTDPCNIVVTRTWTFTDACNNSSSVSQTITIQDTTAPVAPEAPTDITYDCIGDMPAAGELTATDNCAGDITATAVDSMDDTDTCN
ncbi:PKD domain-containing protein, partial [Mangrovimonas futianensis]